MPLTGQLSTMPLPDLLQWIQTGQKSGRVELRRSDAVRVIFFRNGRLTASESSDEADRFGWTLVRSGVLTSADLQKARQVQSQSSTSLGSALVELGLFSVQEVRSFLREKLEDEFAEIASWREGEFLFVGEARVPDRFVALNDDAIAVYLAATHHRRRPNDAAPIDQPRP